MDETELPELSPIIDTWVDAVFAVIGGTRTRREVAAGQGGLVDKRRFLVTRWQQLPAELSANLAQLAAAIGDALPYERPAEIEAAANEALRDMLGTMMQDLQDAADTAINAGDSRYRAVGEAVARCRAICAASPVIAALRDNTILPGARFEAAIAGALDEIEGELVG